MEKPPLNWKRFWCPREGRYSLDDAGFLVDPESEWGQVYAADAVSFESLERFRCLALLGEPGSGKSTTLEQEWQEIEQRLVGTADTALRLDLREFSTDTGLISGVFESPAVKAWQTGNGVLHLGLDSLDECRLHIDNAAQILKAQLRKLDETRLRLRIACRTADWPAGLESALRDQWGPENFGAFELVPLRKKDATLAATAAGIDPVAFLDAVQKLGVAALANRPVTLRFLIHSYRTKKALPDSRVPLYLEGCRRLAEETSESRQDSGALGDLTSIQRLEVAGRLAGITIFSNQYAFWKGLREDMPSGDTGVESVTGGQEGSGAALTAITRDAILETLDTGLFNSRGANRLGWSHQSYAEFLAARYLHNSDMPMKKALQFVLHPDGSGKVVPQLRETAAWFASLNTDVFRALVKTDPETLLRSDIAGAAEADRAALTESLLLAFETNQLVDERELRPLYHRLSCTSLSSILRPYLTDPARNLSARYAAVHITGACDVRDLHSDLTSIGLDPNQPNLVRVAAAAQIARRGDSQAKAALKPLALGLAGDDADDQLKGCGLKATWPDHLTGPELISALTPRKRPNLFGIYHDFLDSDPIQFLRVEDFSTALGWAAARGPVPRIDPMGSIVSQIFEGALKWLERPEIAVALAKALVAHWHFGLELREFGTKLSESQILRQLLAKAMYPLIAIHKHGSLLLMDACLLRPEDVPWLLDDLESSEAKVQDCLAWVIVRCLDPGAVDTYDRVLRTATKSVALATALAPFTTPTILGSEEAKVDKKLYRRMMRRSEAPKSSGPPPPDPGAYETALKTLEPGRFYAIWALGGGLLPSDSADSEPLPGWRCLDELTRNGILEAAESYLRAYASPSSEHWWQEGQFPNYALAAHTALRLLETEASEQFARLDRQIWERWMPIIVLAWSSPGFGSSESRIVQTAYAHAEATFLNVLDEIIEGENARSGFLVLHHLDSFWTPAMADRLRTTLMSGTLKPAAFRHLLGKLLQREDQITRKWTEDLLTAATPAASSEQTIGIAIELIAHSTDAAWSVIWPILQADATFAAAVLAGFESSDPFRSLPFLAKLSPDDVAEFVIWRYPARVNLGAGSSTDDATEKGFPRTVSMILRELAHRGTAPACQALRRIGDARPEFVEIPWHLRAAEELVRRNTWIPLDPEDLLRTISTASARFIRSGSDLLEVLLESLGRLQGSLQGETPAAEDLWFPTRMVVDKATKKKRPVFKPKNEVALSNYVKRHLHHDLTVKGVIVNREVEIRQPMGGAPGERTDIYVAVAVPTAEPGISDRVTAIIEVKGIWNPDLGHAMETQLVDRYLNETGYGYGLYVVGWFACPQWDAKDKRSKVQPYATVAEAQDTFNSKAASLSNPDRRLSAVVLDAALR